jgi:tRNA A37 threonylcarbamoyladenosine synthetase subunit TsaC/SUA5/YrdC
MTNAQDVAAGLPGVTLVLDAGLCDGASSTVVDSTGEVPKLLRAGSIEWEQILAVVAGG